MKHIILFALFFIPLFSNAQIVNTSEEKYRDQIATSRGFLAIGTLMCVIPIVAIQDDEIGGPKQGLFVIGCASILTGVIIHTIGKNNQAKDRLNISIGCVSYKF